MERTRGRRTRSNRSARRAVQCGRGPLPHRMSMDRAWRTAGECRAHGWTQAIGLVHNEFTKTSALPAQESGPRHPALSALTAPVPHVAGGTAHRRPGRACLLEQAGSASGVRCVQLQGGGGSRRGASATDDNAADVRAGAREPGLFRKAGPQLRAAVPGGLRVPPWRRGPRVLPGPYVSRAVRATPQLVSVTFARARGESGSWPRAMVTSYASIWSGRISRIGCNSSGTPDVGSEKPADAAST